uniref:Uncharacterized protein n=1 Tax=Timema shepardi TaxID=629360 RepID=A0A7R9FW94_TIMSH|nr:unnamed protein product [Timema shepardi]
MASAAGEETRREVCVRLVMCVCDLVIVTKTLQPGRLPETNAVLETRLAILCDYSLAPLSDNKMAIFRQTSLDGLNTYSKLQLRTPSPPHWPTSAINITENPISEAVVC